jgi:DNA repair protein RadC
MTSEAKVAAPHYLGHRQRLKERFLKHGAEALADYELLELVLFLALPRRDVKPIAKALLERFGSFADVIAAEPARLAEVAGCGEAAAIALRTIHAAALRMMQEQVVDRPVVGNWKQLESYLRAAMGREKTEQFRVLYLNHKNRLIADEVLQRGTVDHTPVYPREVVKRALELGATALIMVHNHPSGDPKPSQADVAMTREVEEAGSKLGIVLHDHVVVSGGSSFSFRAMGYL